VSESPLVTIGLPVYDSEQHLRQSMDSLLAQTYRDFVLIISDNASTDGTARICQQYAESDSRVRYHRNEKNIGNPANFNRVAKLATTKYLKWSTADDFWEPTFLERALAVMEDDETIALCYPKTYIVDADGLNPRPYEDRLHLMHDDPVDRFLTLISTIELAHQHLGVIRASRLHQTRLLGLHVASDINLLAELTLYGKFYELPERLFYRRFHPKSGSWKHEGKHQVERYLAAGTRRMGFLFWPRHLGFFTAVNRSPIPIRSKLRAYGTLLKGAAWDRKKLLREIVSYVRSKLP
jgi:glycosyltransferase involved in cell wall biosynthesis